MSGSIRKTALYSLTVIMHPVLVTTIASPKMDVRERPKLPYFHCSMLLFVLVCSC